MFLIASSSLKSVFWDYLFMSINESSALGVSGTSKAWGYGLWVKEENTLTQFSLGSGRQSMAHNWFFR